MVAKSKLFNGKAMLMQILAARIYAAVACVFTEGIYKVQALIKVLIDPHGIHSISVFGNVQGYGFLFLCVLKMTEIDN